MRLTHGELTAASIIRKVQAHSCYFDLTSAFRMHRITPCLVRLLSHSRFQTSCARCFVA